MHGAATLRYQQPIPGRAPAAKSGQRGASRMVAKESLAARLPRPNVSLIKRLFWPLVLLALAFGTYELGQRLLPYADRPISKISVKGELSYLNQQSVQERLAPFIAASFFSVDLAGMRAELERMPWIAHAEVRRVWPDQVSIRLEEQLPVARWGDEALLNNQGQAFTPRELSHYENLPQLVGPQRAQEQVMQQYQVLSQMLRPLGFSIVRLELRDRGSWFLTANINGADQSFELLLGRDHLVEKMRRFISIYGSTLKEQITNIARIDLRYSNGLAVTWREPSVTAADKTVAVK
ncbi:cell division protein FtsQ/DivIB [Pseudomonas sp. LS44]|uniref:cell division protein FtsQ/DivIB n=1 Tax=Pseudomonas sp. LS44 TaxID=1357074 RepID=UPI00215A8A57|nr:cell division protein FtsQ/DivIB [Pseudomonas sp. LS44]UVE18607.1 cell division protein FtsQ/DivIB [Pseudomonas sp. LS44]